MDFKKAFTFIFDDPKWLEKLIIPLLVSLIPIVGQLAMSGYILRTIKNVAEGEPFPLPVFEFGKDLGKGFKFFLIGLVYSLPFILLAVLFIVPVATAVNRGSSEVFAVIAGVLTFGIGLLLGLFLIVVMPVVQANFAVIGTFSSGFAFGQIFKMLKNNFISWLLVIAGMILASFIAPIGAIAFAIGALITAFYAQLMVAHLTGQAYTNSQ